MGRFVGLRGDRAPLFGAASGRGLSLVVTLLLCVLLLSVACFRDAFAVEHIDSSRTGSLSMTCEYEQAPLKGLSFDLWHVAGVSEDGSYQLDSEFSACGVDLGSLELASEWDAAAKVMYGVASGASSGASGKAAVSSGASALPVVAHDVSGATGRVLFTGLKPGLYLVSASELVKGKKRYEVAPCLVAVPHLDGTGVTWLYDVKAVPKIEEKDNNDEPGSNPGTNPGGSDKPGSGSDSDNGSGGGSSAGGSGSGDAANGSDGASSDGSGVAGSATTLAQTGENAAPFVILVLLICAAAAVLIATRRRK